MVVPENFKRQGGLMLSTDMEYPPHGQDGEVLSVVAVVR